MTEKTATDKPFVEAAPDAQNKTNSTKTVVIACKTAHGIIMEMGDKEKGTYETYTLNGANSSRVFGGYGLTYGVPKAFAAAWMTKNARHPSVLRGLIYIEGDEASAVDRAKDMRGQSNGLEAWDPVKAAKAKNSKLELDPDYQRQKSTNIDRNRSVEML